MLSSFPINNGQRRSRKKKNPDMYLRLSIGLNILFFGVLVFFGIQDRTDRKQEECLATSGLEDVQQAVDASFSDTSSDSEQTAAEENGSSVDPQQVQADETVSDTGESVDEAGSVDAGLQPGDISVMVLNGSGISGIAGRLEDKLEALGFTDVVAGNASEWGYEVSEVRFEPADRDKAELIAAALGSDFEWSIRDEPYGNQIADVVLVLGDQFNVDSL